jgi:transposase
MGECEAIGASVAGWAGAHGINANVVHSWRKRARGDVGGPMQLAGEFVPVTVEPLALAAPAVAVPHETGSSRRLHSATCVSNA